MCRYARVYILSHSLNNIWIIKKRLNVMSVAAEIFIQPKKELEFAGVVVTGKKRND